MNPSWKDVAGKASRSYLPQHFPPVLKLQDWRKNAPSLHAETPNSLWAVVVLFSWKTSVQALDGDQGSWFGVGQTEAGALRCGDALVECPELSL